MDVLPNDLVAIAAGFTGYAATPPWHPATAWPEYPYASAGLSRSNPAYDGVRQALVLLGLDAAHLGSAAWNPLGTLVRPGDTVVLKPNFIRDFHDEPERGVECLITHGSVIRAVLDYVARALQGRGRVVVADAPQCEASFERIQVITGLNEIRAFYAEHSGIAIDVVDLRPEYTEKVDGVIIGHRRLAGDPLGYAAVNLGRDSEFTAINHLNAALYGSEYDRSEVAAHHRGEVHEYLISRTVLSADVFINLPKLKTHKKVGATLSLKNLVGINGNKNWLPHHREGVPACGGDQYANSGLSERLEQFLLERFKRHFPKLGRWRRYLGAPAKRLGRAAFGDTNRGRIRSGNWHGNDTTWRMVLDLNRALRYADADGRLHATPRRRYFSLVDGIVAGEGNGPMGCDARPAGVIVAGTDPLAVDLACTRLIGFDYRKLPVFAQALRPHRYSLACGPYEALRCRSNQREFDRRLSDFVGPALAFEPHFGWRGHVEVESRGTARCEAGQTRQLAAAVQ